MNENLAKALVKAQAEMPVVQMNATNPFLNNKYADLGAIIAAVRPVLKKHGLAFSQFAVGRDSEVGVKTVLMHESGEFLEDTITLPLAGEKGKSGAQVAGSIITYLRRYSLSAILGIYADEDADGNGNGTKQKPVSRKTTEPTNNKNIFETVKTKDGTLYSTLEIPDLAAHVNGIIDHLKKNPDMTPEKRSEFELKRDAAEYYIKEKTT